MDMDFDIKERLVLLQILPVRASYTDIQLIQKIRADLALSEDEQKAIDFKQMAGECRWDDDKEAELGRKTITIGPRALSIINETLVKMDREQKLEASMIGLYERFVLDQLNETEVRVPVSEAEFPGA